MAFCHSAVYPISYRRFQIQTHQSCSLFLPAHENSNLSKSPCTNFLQISESRWISTRTKGLQSWAIQSTGLLDVAAPHSIQLTPNATAIPWLSNISGSMQRLASNLPEKSYAVLERLHIAILADLDPATAKVVISIVGPLLSAFGFLFILRIVMSWYPKLPVDKFPYILAYAPTEPLLSPTRKVIPPVGGVDVTPVVWFGLVSFLNEILVGPQGLLVLLSQQV